MSFQEIAQTIAGYLPSASAAFGAVAGASFTALSFYAFGNDDNFLTSPIKNAALRAGGFTLAASNSNAIADHQTPYQAVKSAFEANPKLDYIFMELADRAIVAKRGGKVKVLDFTRPKEEMHDAVVYSQMKEMVGHKSMEEIYQFAIDGLGYELDDIYNEEISGLNILDATRIMEHAEMNCSWARKLKNFRNARLQIEAAFTGMLTTLSMDPETTPFEVPSNISEKGTYAFRWSQPNGDNQKSTGIFIKPRTDTEKDIHTKLFGTRLSNKDKNGAELDGNQGIMNYRYVKNAQATQDRADTEEKLIRFRVLPDLINPQFSI